ncbi:hypothetical protein GQ53DRAFT_751779 [Thozetella sp. PMI_491]|nr:hypothetical protein GQ53DRAFT_751779 [Thozetella sp. PMI_491]
MQLQDKIPTSRGFGGGEGPSLPPASANTERPRRASPHAGYPPAPLHWTFTVAEIGPMLAPSGRDR